MPQTIGYDDVVGMLRAAAAKVRDEQLMLSRLDSVIGDGDHGTTMRRAMDLVEKACNESKAGTLKGLLNDVGWAVLGVDGGATGPLLGMFFIGMAETAPEAKDMGLAAAAAAFEGGLANLRKQTPAQVGDKTMVDALAPAVAALRAAADAGEPREQAFRKAACAAEAGAQSTRNVPAKFGRARNLGDRSIGHQDAGATSIALVFRAFADTLK